MNDIPASPSSPRPEPFPAAGNLTDSEREELRRHGILLTSLEELYNWGRSNSVWPLQFGLACCAIEMIAAATARFDIARCASGSASWHRSSRPESRFVPFLHERAPRSARSCFERTKRAQAPGAAPVESRFSSRCSSVR